MVPNTLLEKAYRSDLGGRGRVLLFILRETLGELKAQGDFSGRWIARNTGLGRRSADEALEFLVEEGFLLRISAPTGRRSGTYRVAGTLPPSIRICGQSSGQSTARKRGFAGTLPPKDLEEDLRGFSTGAGEDEILR